MRFCPRCGTRYEHERFCPEDGVPTEPLPHSAPEKDALIGTVVDGRYRVEEQIGEGGMGVVYRATHVTLNKALALKVLRGDMARDVEVVQRFIQEAQAATSIGHENIIDISDFGRLPDGTVFFVMEYLAGQPLNDMIKRGGSIPVATATHIIRQIAGALGAAHARGIVHRDLKPDNVYLVTRGELSNFVKVLDFGIAKVGGASNKITRTGMVFGTPHYMSPEQAAGQSVDARTDIYALGVIMYEMFTGHVPFDADTFMGVLTKHMFEKPPPMGGKNTERLLGALEDITFKALEKKPEHRYPSMQALIEDLDRVAVGGAPRIGHAAGPALALADALEPRSRAELQVDEQLASSARARPMPWLWAGLGAGVVVALVGVVVVFAHPGERNPPPRPGALPSLPRPLAPSSPASGGPLTPSGALEAVVEIDTVPSGATLVMEGAIVGTTPVKFPRPEHGQHLVELRLDGYQRESVHIPSEGPASLRITLKKRPIEHAIAEKKPEPAASKHKESKRPSVRSEVVDPWAE